MKWTNRGHQLDHLGEKYLKVKNIYFFGSGEKTVQMYEFLCWLGVDKDFNICFVQEEDVLAEDGTFMGQPAISYCKELRNRIAQAPEENVVVLPRGMKNCNNEPVQGLEGLNLFYYSTAHNQQDNFIQNFVCVWYMYKHDKLLSHWTNYFTTSRCNLNCQYCFVYVDRNDNPKDVIFEEFKENADLFFSKFDQAFSFHFAGGEALLSPLLPSFLHYLSDAYGDRIYDFFIVTNGTVIPSDEVIAGMKALKGHFLIDNYSRTVSFSKIKEMTEKMDANDIKYNVVDIETWWDLDIEATDYPEKTEEELIAQKINCNTYLQEFGEKKFYACYQQQYANRVGITELDETDFIELEHVSKMELLEFRQGYTPKGYSSLCSHCLGLGEAAKKVPVAVQLPPKKRG